MLKIINDNLLTCGAEILVNAANAMGPMGAGIAGVLARAGGKELTDDVYRICKSVDYDAGKCYISEAGNLNSNGVKAIYHCVTMKCPGGYTDLNIISRSMTTALDLAVMNKVLSIAFPGLGTGIGGLDIKEVAKTMVNVAKQYEKSLDIIICDINKDFIDACLEATKE